MITHVIVKLDLPIEEKYWEDDDVFSNEYYGIGKPLILCKDCMHYDADNFQCETDKPHSGTWFPESYCDRAEREEPNTHER